MSKKDQPKKQFKKFARGPSERRDLLDVKNADPMELEAWQGRMESEANQLYTGMSSVFSLLEYPELKAAEIEVPRGGFNDQNDPDGEFRKLQSEVIKSKVARMNKMIDAKGALFGKMMSAITEESKHLLERNCYDFHIEKAQREHERAKENYDFAAKTLAKRAQIRARRQKRADRHRKVIERMQAEEEAERMREIQSSTEPEQAKYGTRGRGRPAATSKDGQDEEDSSASAAASAAAAAEAQRMSEKRAEWKRRAAMWDSDTEDEKIPEDDDDLIGYTIVGSEFVPPPSQNVWARFTSKADPLELWKLIRETNLSKRASCTAMDSVASMEKLWNLTQRPGQSLPKYFQVWRTAVSVVESSGEAVPSEKLLVRKFIKSLDPDRFDEWQRECANKSESTNPEEKARAWPSTVDEAYNTACKRERATKKKYNQALAYHAAAEEEEEAGVCTASAKGNYTKTCHFCRNEGHFMRECPLLEGARQKLKEQSEAKEDKAEPKTNSKKNGKKKKSAEVSSRTQC